jgi:hypothetical protein
MLKAEQEEAADQARAALLSDIRDIKEEGRELAANVGSKLPWIVGGVVALVAIGGGISLAMRPRRFSYRRPSLFAKLARAAALSAVGIGTRHLVVRALDKALPERNPRELHEPEPAVPTTAGA